jgi:hypothetical protein
LYWGQAHCDTNKASVEAGTMNVHVRMLDIQVFAWGEGDEDEAERLKDMQVLTPALSYDK